MTLLYLNSFSQSVDLCSNAKCFDEFAKNYKTSYPGDNNIDIVYYKLDFDLFVEDEYIESIVTIKAKSKINNLLSFSLDFSHYLTVDSILLNEARVNFSHSNYLLSITPINPLIINELFTIEIFYRGTPNPVNTNSFMFDEHNSESCVWTLSQPYGTPDWFPCKDTPGDKADSADIWIRCDRDLIPVSNGNLEEIIQDTDSTHIYKWKCSYPIAHYLLSLAIANYSKYSNVFIYKNDTMNVDHYIYPENLNSALKSELDKTIDMLKIFTDLFGQYPFINEKYGHAEFRRNGGMEHQTISSMGSFNEFIIAHELAHQWFGDKITCVDWQNIWLNEGFATYAEKLYAEVKYGKLVYDDLVLQMMTSAKNAKGSVYVKDINQRTEIFNRARSYDKGGTILHMLRGVVGDNLFFEILKDYATDSSLAYGVAVTEDFKNIAEKISGQDLDYFFDEWVYGENFPVYEYDWSYQPTAGNKYQVILSLNQIENSNPKFFTMPIEISIKFDNQDTCIKILNNKQNQDYNFTISEKPTQLIVDPNHWILMESYSRSNFDIHTFQLRQNYPNPFNAMTIIEFSIPSIEDVSLKIFNILGEEMKTLINEERRPGIYKVSLSADNFPSGVYIYQLISGSKKETKKMVLLR
ncbi:MAG: T9SS type A sorting domain-containing protein [Ignavibacteriales bacterium]|nr:T9SS type A sorting domain-containing protein [Ignavibacteriales bacterium]